MSDEIEQIQMESELELGKIKFQQEAMEEAKALGLIDDKDEIVPNGNKAEISEEKSEDSTEREYSDIEKEQMECGWDPNKEGGVSATEFKRVGEIIEAKRTADKRAKAASSEVQELTKTVKNLVEHNKKLEKASYQKALDDLQGEREQRILEGDVQAVRDLDLKEKVLEKAKESVQVEVSVQAPTQELSKDADAYLERNKFWLEGTTAEDKKMQILTNKVIDYLKEAEPDISEAQAIKSIEDELQTKFPHRFDNPNKEKASAVIAKSTAKSGKISASLSQDERSTFLSIQRVDPEFTLDEYVKQLETIGRRS